MDVILARAGLNPHTLQMWGAIHAYATEVMKSRKWVDGGHWTNMSDQKIADIAAIVANGQIMGLAKLMGLEYALTQVPMEIDRIERDTAASAVPNAPSAEAPNADWFGFRFARR